MESGDLSWSITVGHGVRGGEWEKSGFIEAKRHIVSWSMSMNIMTNKEAKQQEREKHSQELQDRLVVKLEDEEKRTFDKGEEEYEHMLMDLQELSLGVTHMDEGEWVRRAPAPNGAEKTAPRRSQDPSIFWWVYQRPEHAPTTRGWQRWI